MRIFYLVFAAANAGYGSWMLATGGHPVVGAINVAAAVLCFGAATARR